MKAILIVYTKSGLSFSSKPLYCTNQETFVERIQDAMGSKTICVEQSDSDYIGCLVDDIEYFKIIFQE